LFPRNTRHVGVEFGQRVFAKGFAMTHPSHFKLSSRGLLLAAISAAFPQHALANTGRVDFTAGKVTLTGTDGSTRQLTRGAEVKTGDRIVSEAGGRAQIRFSDGSFVSLQPNTDFDIKNYAFSGKTDGSEKALFGLVKGAMRTVTGLVGRVNRNAYQVTTPTATVGIRGTGGVISVNVDGTTLVLGTSGVWTLSNPSGSVDVPAGRAAAVGPNTNEPPRQVSSGPNTPAPDGSVQQVQEEQEEPPRLPTTPQQSENRTTTGTTTVIEETKATFIPLKTGAGYNVAFVGAEGGSIRQRTSSTATFDSVGRMTAFTGQAILIGEINSPDYSLAGTHAEFSTTSGVLAWGRWIGQVNAVNTCCSSGNFTANQGVHYVVGIPTPQANLPAGQAFTYNMIGATQPTALNGSVAPGTLSSATLTGNFLFNTVSGNFAGSIDGKSFSAEANMTLNPATASFSGMGSFSGTLRGTGCCASAFVNGFFSGAGASHAGFVYRLDNTTIGATSFGSSVTGAVALSKGAEQVIHPPMTPN